MSLGYGALVLAGFLAVPPGSVNFDAVQRGTAPPNWTVTPGRSARQPRWSVRFDPTAPSRGNVLEQTGNSASDESSPLALFDPVICRDGDLSVKFRIDPRGTGHTAGVVWRYQDDKNYYLLDFSATQKKISLYRVQNGVRQPVRIRGARPGVFHLEHDVKTGQWHLARVNFRGDGIKVYLGNRRLFEAEDSGLRGAGKTGVLTGGATVAAFDDFRIDKKI
ncbi:MAG TPA: hypothetical protein VNH18_21835 [Bryobacteraceae bacterium]|nr:hypothetical protein [Bryobacteraceae bacterium]